MGYILTFFFGNIFGFTMAAIMSASGQYDRIQEAYEAGYEAGLSQRN